MNQKQFLANGQYLENEVRSRAQKVGSHFFDADTMRFFSSRVSELMWKKGDDIYFVTSEADKGHIKHKGSIRAYTVRKCSKEGSIDPISDFQEYPTLAQARTAIKEVLEN